MEFGTVLHQIGYYLQKLGDFILYKLGLAMIFAALMEHAHMLTVLALLYIIDFVCGFAVAWRLRGVSSAAMRRGLAKAVLYMVFIMTIHIAETAITGGLSTFATSTAIGILIFTESLSIIENLINLGLPMPYAVKVMRALASKAKIIGIDLNLESNYNNAIYVNDVMSMVRVHIPRLQNGKLRQLMRVYYLNWLDFLRTIDAAILNTRDELAWERLKASIDETVTNAFESALREGVDQRLATAFFYEWNREPIAGLYSRAKRHVYRCEVAAEIIDSVSATLVTLLYQTLNRSALWDRTLQNEGRMPHGEAVSSDLPGVESGAHPVLIRKTTRMISSEDEPTPHMPNTPIPLEPDSGSYQALDVDALEPLDEGSGKQEKPSSRTLRTEELHRTTKRMPGDEPEDPLIKQP